MTDADWEPGQPVYPEQRPRDMCHKCGTRWAAAGVMRCPVCGAENLNDRRDR